MKKLNNQKLLAPKSKKRIEVRNKSQKTYFLYKKKR